MFFYIGLWLSLIALSVILKGKTWKGRKIFLGVSFVLLLFFYIFRSENVGWDTKGYLNVFMTTPSREIFHSYLEPGWVALMKIVYSISPTQQMLFFVFALLGMGCYYIITEKLSYNVFLSIVLYYMFGNWFNLMNQTRCQIAVCICMFSFYFLCQKKYLWSIIIVLFAFSIHESAIVFLLFILCDVVVKKYSWKLYGLFVLGAGGVMLLYDKIFLLLTQHFFTSYTIESSLVRHTKGGNLKMFSMFLILLIILVYVDNYVLEKEKDRAGGDEEVVVSEGELRLKKLLFTSILFSLTFQLVSVNNTMIARFSNYFSVYFTILIPNILNGIKNRRKKMQYTVVIVGFMLLYMIIYLVFSENGHGRDGVIPYELNLL